MKNFVPKFGREVRRGQQINRNTKQFLKIDLETTQVEKGSARQSVNEQVEVTSVRICPGKNGAKDTNIACPSGNNSIFDCLPIIFKSC